MRRPAERGRPGTWRARAALTAVVALLAGCTAGPDAVPETEPRAQDLPGRAVRVQTWEAPAAPEPLSQVAAAGDAVVYLGGAATGPPVLVALDAATGGERFTVPVPDLADSAADRGDHVVGGPDGSTTVAGRGGPDGSPYVALTYDRTGRLRWRTGAPGFPVLVTAAGVVVSDGTHGPSTTSLLDARTGRVRWAADLGTVLAAEGDVVVSLVEGPQGADRLSTRATDLRTGAQLWSVGHDDAGGARPEAVAGGVVVVSSTRAGEDVLTLHDARTGAVRGTLAVPDARDAVVQADPQTGTLVVQAGEERTLHGFSPDRPGTPLWTASDPFADLVPGATGGGLLWQRGGDGVLVRDVRSGRPYSAGTADPPSLPVAGTWVGGWPGLGGETVRLDAG